MNPFSIDIPLKIDDTYSMNNTAHWTKKNAQKKAIEETERYVNSQI